MVQLDVPCEMFAQNSPMTESYLDYTHILPPAPRMHLVKKQNKKNKKQPLYMTAI